jgi:capsular exopolysaccharide synthesis family protein
MEIIEVNQYLTKEFLASEAIKTLRTNLLFCGKNVKCVGLTSFSASEGKSTISVQLAASLAQIGKSVVLVDTDLRKSVLQSRFSVHADIMGLSHYLSGMAQLENIVYETDLAGLAMVFSGPHVPNAVELLSSAQFQQFIGLLRERFDYLIIDTPPLGQVVDCAVMSPALDGVMLVIDATRNSCRLERRLLKQLERAGGKVLGAILNRVDFKDKTGYYGKTYGKKYGYE